MSSTVWGLAGEPHANVHRLVACGYTAHANLEVSKLSAKPRPVKDIYQSMKYLKDPFHLIAIEIQCTDLCDYCLRQETMFSLASVCVSACPGEFVDSKTLGTVATAPVKFATHTPWVPQMNLCPRVITLACYSATNRQMCPKHIYGQ